MRKILRSIYLDQQIDEALATRADVEGTTKAELMRTYIASGLEQPAHAFVSRSQGVVEASLEADERAPHPRRRARAHHETEASVHVAAVASSLPRRRTAIGAASADDVGGGATRGSAFGDEDEHETLAAPSVED